MNDEQVAEGQRRYLELKAAAAREAADPWGLGAPCEPWPNEFVGEDGWRFVDGRYVPPPQFLRATWRAYAPEGVTVTAEMALNYMAARRPAPCTWYRPDQPAE